MKEIIGTITVLLCFIAYVPYFKDIFAKKTMPHPYSWLIWGLTSILIFALQVSHGAGAGSYATATVAVISLIVCALAFRNGGRKDITYADTLCFIAALVGIALWLVADQPTSSMVLLVGADLIGFIPSIRKAWYKPFEETLSLWTINGFRHILTLFALESYSLLTILNSAVWIVGIFGFVIVLVTRRRTLAGQKHAS